jgi:hypothetical protein
MLWVYAERRAGNHARVSSEERVCPACGLATPAGARFCQQCGHPLEGDLPEAAYERTAPRLFGVLAPGPTFVLGCVLLLGGLLALFAGSPIAAIALAALAAATFVLFVGAAERDPESPLARRATTSGHQVRDWAVFLRESGEAWAHAVRDVVKLGRESRSLRGQRDRVLLALGDAAYREDTVKMDELRLRLREIDEGLAARERARVATLAKARRHMEEERVAVQPTQQFSVQDLTPGGQGDD